MALLSIALVDYFGHTNEKAPPSLKLLSPVSLRTVPNSIAEVQMTNHLSAQLTTLPLKTNFDEVIREIKEKEKGLLMKLVDVFGVYWALKFNMLLP